MNGVLAVAKREFKTFFASPIAYIVLGGFLLIAGWLYFSTLLLAGQASLRNFFAIAPVLFVVLVPAITMRSVAEDGRTMIVVTHEMGFAREVSNHVVFLHQGQIEEQGAPDEVLQRPSGERLRAFLSNSLK